MSSFQQILQIAQEQAEAAARGDLLAAAARLQERGLLLQAAPLAERAYPRRRAPRSHRRQHAEPS